MYAYFMIGEVPPAPILPEEIHGRKICGLITCYNGPQDKMNELIQPARDIAEPMFEYIGPMPYPVLQGLLDPLIPPGLQWYWKGDFFNEIPDEAIAEHMRFGGDTPSNLSQMHL